MIRTTGTHIVIGDLIRRLRSKGEAIALRRARGLTKRRNFSGHLWRSPARLWPDMFKDS